VGAEGATQGRSRFRAKAATALPDTRRAELLARFLVPCLAPLEGGRPSCRDAVDDPEVRELAGYLLGRVVDQCPELRARAAAADAGGAEALAALRTGLAEALADRPARLGTLWALLEVSGTPEWKRYKDDMAPAAPVAPAAGGQGPSRRWPVPQGGGIPAGVVALAVVLSLTAVVAVAVLAARMLSVGVQLGLLKCFAIVVLATLPGWLFLRFIVFRAGALWTEYVLNLHRLGVDQHEFLPEPPPTSGYFALWYAGGGSLLSGSPNVYRQKFEAYYGKAVASLSAGAEKAVLSDRTLVPVYLSTLIFAAGWVAVLGRDPLFGDRLTMPVDALRFAFMGAYSFVLQMMIRRYFQSDLKASAYLSAITRVVTVLILVLVLHWAVPAPSWLTPGRQCGTAFLIGFFPLVGMQLLQKGITAQARRWLPTLENPYPLSELFGLNVWYEARLLEEGIEDMENLTSANLVDVLLHTRVPVGRLVDWIDQAHLYLALQPLPTKKEERRARREDRRRGADGGRPEVAAGPNHRHVARDQRVQLRRLGVRGATDLESLFQSPDELHERSLSRAVLVVDQAEFVKRLRVLLNGGREDGPNVAEAMLKVFCNSPGLIHVRHWRDMLLRWCHSGCDVGPGAGNHARPALAAKNGAARRGTRVPKPPL
jgi:hypothetical protein